VKFQLEIVPIQLISFELIEIFSVGVQNLVDQRIKNKEPESPVESDESAYRTESKRSKKRRKREKRADWRRFEGIEEAIACRSHQRKKLARMIQKQQKKKKDE
jgi:hypothetical protein